MPCVFPILALKALHLAKSGGDEREARRDALGYAAGAIIGTGALGVALLAIRAAGTEVGWAFQLQDPRTILVLLLLTTAITLNLLHVFEVPVVTRSALPSDSFGTGALAAFVATPCAGPFLGAALGTALLLAACRVGRGVRGARPRARAAVRRGRLRSGAAPAPAQAGPVDGEAAAHSRHPDGADGAGLPVAAVAARRRRGVQIGLGHGGRLRIDAGRRWPVAAEGPADRLCRNSGGACRRRGGDLGDARASRCCCTCGRRRRAVERGAGRAGAERGPPGVRLFHRRLVPDLQGQRERRRSTAKRCATRSSRRT